MIDKKIKESNYIYLTIILIVLIAFSNVIDSYHFLSMTSKSNFRISAQDVFIYITYGLNTSAGTNLLDIMRFSIPYLLCILSSGIYISDMIENSNKYPYIIRYGKYENWIKNILKNIFLFVIIFFTVYYLSLFIISIMFTKNTVGITEVFYNLNPYYIDRINPFRIILYQYFINLLFGVLLILLQLLLNIMFNISVKIITFLSSIIIVFSFLGKYEFYNPFMLSKHSLMNYKIGVSPNTTIFLCMLTDGLIYFILTKFTKYLVRRDNI